MPKTLRYPLFFTFLFLFHLSLSAQPEGFRIDPPNWWVSMENPQLELMVYGEGIQSYSVELSYPGVRLTKRIEAESPNYLFLQLHIEPSALAGTMSIRFTKSAWKKFTIDYPLLERDMQMKGARGFDSSDLIYLIMPDRFANGDPGNDSHSGMLESVDRENPDGRHGGDIQGIEQSLDYIENLGVTALWLNPVYENNQPRYSYHGYSITDYYAVDARLGGNAAYESLAESCRERNIVLIKDMILNHCGSKHRWISDLPFTEWVHGPDSFIRTSYRATTVFDPYVSESDATRFREGWFDTTMPDLNQDHPQLASYLIQQSIWWVERYGLGGIRMDTQAYPNPDFMEKWANRMKQEYPDLTLIGEIWEGRTGFISYWHNSFTSYQSGLDGVFDFPLHDAVKMGLNEHEGWWEGFSRIYASLAQDWLLKDAWTQLIFPDNHDVERIFEVLNQDYARFEMAMALYYTMRGIPQIYYGTEILMTGNKSKGDGAIRQDMPGGWPGDSICAFTGKQMNKQTLRAQQLLQRLGKWRKEKAVIHDGKLVHFIPENGIYVYFRYVEDDAVMVVLNKNEADVALDTRRFAERLDGYQYGYEVIRDRKIGPLQKLLVPARGAMIIDLEK